MIIKSTQISKSGGSMLARHLMNTEENEQVLFGQKRHLFADNPIEAMDLMLHIANLSKKCQKPFFHVNINPDCPMSEKQWEVTWNLYEAEYGLSDQHFFEETHLKKGRIHKHRVYLRVKPDGQAIHIKFNKLRDQKISRILEYCHEHPLTMGAQNRAIIKHLKSDGLDDIAKWMMNQGALELPRPVANQNHNEFQEYKKKNSDVAQVTAELQAAYRDSLTGEAFRVLIESKGYYLVRGDRRAFLIVDPWGAVHNPAKRLGLRVSALKERWGDLELPSLDEVREMERVAGLEALRVEREAVEAEIQGLEGFLDLGRD